MALGTTVIGMGMKNSRETTLHFTYNTFLPFPPLPKPSPSCLAGQHCPLSTCYLAYNCRRLSV